MFLVAAGVAHLVVPGAFRAQMPPALPDPRLLITVSGLAEIGLGTALIAAPRRQRAVGWLVVAFLVVVWPGNLHQAISGTDGFGLTTDRGRWIRVASQPLLMAWAWWATRTPRGDDARQATGSAR
jgi:uncharacterized membrane protein